MKKRLSPITKILMLAVISAALVALGYVFGKPKDSSDLRLEFESGAILEPEEYVENGKLMVPVRSFADRAGAEVYLDSETMIYTISMDGKEVLSAIGGTDEYASVMHGGLAYTSLDTFTEGLGAEYTKETEGKIVTVTIFD